MKRRTWLAALVALCMLALPAALASEADAGEIVADFSGEAATEIYEDIDAEPVDEIGAEAVEQDIDAVTMDLDGDDAQSALLVEYSAVEADAVPDNNESDTGEVPAPDDAPTGDESDAGETPAPDKDESDAGEVVAADDNSAAEEPAPPADPIIASLEPVAEQVSTAAMFGSTAGTITDDCIGKIDSVTYNGSPWTPEVVVTLNGTTLQSGTDYDVDYANNVNAGQAKVIITLKGNYQGSGIKYFTINPASITGATVTCSPDTYTYDGNAKTPGVTVKLGETTLESDDYTVSYINNINAREYATVIVTGKGNYTGEARGTFTINKAECRLYASYIGPAFIKEYDGTCDPFSSAFIYVYSGDTNRSIGGGGYSGLSNSAHSVFYDDLIMLCTEDGNPTDSFCVSSYNASFQKANIGPQKVTIKISIKEWANSSPPYNYDYVLDSDTLVVDGEIKPFSLRKHINCRMASQRYTGSPIKPGITLKSNKKTLVEGTDYDIAYTNNVNPGTATISLTGKGIYCDTGTIRFEITPISIRDNDITLVHANKVQYTGNPVNPDVSVVFTEQVNGTVVKKTLEKGKDYEVLYYNNVEPGCATLTVIGKGGYTGTRTSVFYIEEAGPVAPAPAASVITATSSTRTSVSAAPGSVYRLDLGGQAGTKFKSSNRKVATVDQNGNVTFKKPGKVKITFKVGKKKRTVTLKVTDPTIPTSVSLAPVNTAVKKGDVVTLTPSVPENANPGGYKWKSSNKKVATVKNGVVTFKKPGKVTITCTAKRGKKKARVKFRVSK